MTAALSPSLAPTRVGGDSFTFDDDDISFPFSRCKLEWEGVL
jgi:hypothetical protein